MPRRSSKRSSQKNLSSLDKEVQRLFMSGAADNTELMLSLRQRYGDENVANKVMEAFVERHQMVVRRAKKFADAVRQRYSSQNLPYHQLLLKVRAHSKKLGLSEAEFAEFVRIYEQELAGTGRQNEVVLPFTNMLKVLGSLTGSGRTTGFSLDDNDYRNLQEILRLHEASKPLHSQVVLQNLTYNDSVWTNVVSQAKLDKTKHNPHEHVHPVIAAMFAPQLDVLSNHFLYANISGIVKNLYNKEPLTTRPDYELYYNLVTDPNDVVCDNRTPVADLLQRCNLQNQLWNAVLHLRNGQMYNSSFREFMTAVDVCRLNKHDNPDLVYGRHDGTILKRIISAFSFRPTTIATVPVANIFAFNPYAQNVRPTISNVPMINIRLMNFTPLAPLNVVAPGAPAPAVPSVKNALEQQQTFIEGNMLVPRATRFLFSRGVVFVYVDRRASVMRLGMNYFNMANLPQSVGGIERVNTKECNVNLSFGESAPEFEGDNYTLASAVMVKTTTADGMPDTIKSVTGSTAWVQDWGKNNPMEKTDKGVIFNAGKLNVGKVYDPVDALTAAENKCWNEPKGELQEKLNTTAVILMYKGGEGKNIVPI